MDDFSGIREPTWQTVMLVVFANVNCTWVLQTAGLPFGLGVSGIMPCHARIIRQLFPATEAGWRIATQYPFAASGMAFYG